MYTCLDVLCYAVCATIMLCFVWVTPVVHALVSPEQDQAFACGQNALG